MNTSQITALIYKIVPNDTYDFSNTPSVIYREKKFCVRACGNEVRFDLKKSYDSVDTARKVVEKYIQKWELETGLDWSIDGFGLEFDYAIDESPGMKVKPIRVSVSVSKPTAVVGIPRYPPSPSRLKIDPIVTLMYDRYMRYRHNRDTLPSMTYFCLTILEKKFGGRPAAGRVLSVSHKLLKKISRLSSTKGGRDARKGEGAYTPLTESERLFLENATNRIIRRYAEFLGRPTHNFPIISRSDITSTST